MVNEQLFGTVPETQVWIMLESTHPPGANALEDSVLPGQVKSYLAGCIKSLPTARFQLLRQKNPGDVPRLFLAITRQTDNRLYEVPIFSYDTLLNLNLGSDLEWESQFKPYQRNDPILLVCTNGKRDPCCSQHGIHFFEPLQKKDPDNVFQTSHLGGHRFAPTAVCLPGGYYYGRLAAMDAEGLVKANRLDRVYINKLRGRACYNPPVQAGEYYLRQRTSEYDVHAYLLVNAHQEGVVWEIQFRHTQHHTTHLVTLSEEMSSHPIFESCSKPAESHPRVQYQLINHRILE